MYPQWVARACGGPFDPVHDLAAQVQVAEQARPLHTPTAGATQAADRLEPAEDFFHALTNPLTHGVAGVPGGPPINRAAALAARVLSDMRGDTPHPLIRHALRGIVVLVRAQGPGAKAPVVCVVEQVQDGLPFGGARRRGYLQID